MTADQIRSEFALARERDCDDRKALCGPETSLCATNYMRNKLLCEIAAQLAEMNSNRAVRSNKEQTELAQEITTRVANQFNIQETTLLNGLVTSTIRNF